MSPKRPRTWPAVYFLESEGSSFRSPRKSRFFTGCQGGWTYRGRGWWLRICWSLWAHHWKFEGIKWWNYWTMTETWETLIKQIEFEHVLILYTLAGALSSLARTWNWREGASALVSEDFLFDFKWFNTNSVDIFWGLSHLSHLQNSQAFSQLTALLVSPICSGASFHAWPCLEIYRCWCHLLGGAGCSKEFAANSDWGSAEANGLVSMCWHLSLFWLEHVNVSSF